MVSELRRIDTLFGWSLISLSMLIPLTDFHFSDNIKWKILTGKFLPVVPWQKHYPVLLLNNGASYIRNAIDGWSAHHNHLKHCEQPAVPDQAYLRLPVKAADHRQCWNHHRDILDDSRDLNRWKNYNLPIYREDNKYGFVVGFWNHLSWWSWRK